MDTPREFQSCVHYYMREGLYHHVHIICSQRIDDPVFRYWRGIALLKEGLPSEAVKDLKEIENNKELALAIHTVLREAHQKCKLVDADAVEELTQKIELEQNRTGGEQSLLQLACFHWHNGDHTTARSIAQKLGDYHDEYMQANCLRGWIDLTCGKAQIVQKSIQIFDSLESKSGNQPGNKRDIDALLGKAEYSRMQGSFGESLEILNRVAVTWEKYTPVYACKAKILIAMGDWEQASEVLRNSLKRDPHNVEALMYMIFYTLVRENKPQAVVQSISDLGRALQECEPRNAKLFVRCARTFSRISGGVPTIIKSIMAHLLEKANKIEVRSDGLNEMAYEYSLLGDYNEALNVYKKASQVDDGNVQTLLGIIKCHLNLGKLDDAEQHLSFLQDILQNSTEDAAELNFCTAILRWKKSKNRDESVKKLEQAVGQLEKLVAGKSVTFDFYILLNPMFLMQVVKEYLQHCPSEPPASTDVPNPVAEKAVKPLELLTQYLPGNVHSQLLLAKVKFIEGDLKNAQNAVQQCIRAEGAFAESHLLMAQIYLHSENYMRAKQHLDQATSMEVEIKYSPLYLLVEGRVKIALGDYDEALASLEQALQICKGQIKGKKRDVTPQDLSSIYVELVSGNLKMKGVTNYQQAQKYISDALAEFKNTPEEGKIVVCQAMVALKKDADHALNILRTIPPNSQYFLKAKAQMAQIYLNQRNNKRMYAKCYEELVEAYPSASSFMFLGDAYLSIQEPEKAIASLERALQLDPSNVELISKIGKALITTHEYQKAIEYYEHAISKEPMRASLRLDLAELYRRMKIYDKADEVLKGGLDALKATTDDVHLQISRVSLLMLLAKVHRTAGDIPSAIQDLTKARVFQTTVMTKVRDVSEVIYAQRLIASQIASTLGELLNESGQTEKAVQSFHEALKQDETHEKSMLELAKIYLNQGNLELCEYQCGALVRVDAGNEEGTMMLADVMFRKNKFEEAAYNYQQMLERNPINYNALVHYVQLLRRAGKLSEAPKYIKLAEKAQRRRTDPGLHYAKGIYHRYTHSPKDAIEQFHQGRNPRDTPWAEKCVIAMIEIYLSPDNEGTIWESAENENSNSTDIPENVKAAQKLLKDVHDEQKKELLEAYCLMATKRKENIDAAFNKLYEITCSAQPSTAANTQSEKVHVPCTVGMATALQIQKQTPKARNHLKRVAKAQYNPEEADDFERGWLLLADIYINQGGKYDLAHELLRRCINFNKSCGKAWEFMGLIYEKEQSYKDAAECYEHAWKLSHETDPSIGYKLAFNYLKARKLVGAIDVCHKVLTSHPNYPKIRKDILDKARQALRP